MSTPSVAGTAALVREYFLQNNKERLLKYELFNKSPTQTLSGTLVKATIIHSAEGMKGNVSLDKSQTVWADLSTKSLPNIYTGFGRVNIGNVFLFDQIDASFGKLFTINRYELEPNSKVTAQFKTNSKTIVKATMAYYDKKGTLTTKGTSNMKQLINDLDLIITTNSSSNTFYGNSNLSGNRGNDEVNNVERITLDEVDEDTFLSIQISAKKTNVGAQNFSLVVTGDLQFIVLNQGHLLKAAHMAVCLISIFLLVLL